MGGCSSKPQTAECNEPLHLLFHNTTHSSPPQGSQHTLKSLFAQHVRDGEDLLGNAQTLHELLLHAVDSKELPDSENQSTENTEANLQISFPCKQNSPVSVLSNAAENNASKCTKEGSLPNLAEASGETGAKLESFMSNLVQVTEENAEKCTKAEGFTPNSAEGNPEKGGFLSGLEEEKCGKLEENAEEAEGFLSNVAEENPENTGKLEGFESNLAEVKIEEECAKLRGVLSNCAEGNAESESSPGSLNLELKSEKIPESNSSECADYKTGGLDLGPNSEFFNISGPNLLESPSTDVFLASDDAMESKEAEVHGLNEIAIDGETKREVLQDEVAMEAKTTPKHDEEATKCKKSLHGKETEEQIGEAMEGAEMEKAMEGKKTELHCENALELAKDKISQEGDKSEVQNAKAMEGELLKVQFESGGISWVQGEKAMEDDMLRENTEKAMDCEIVDMQDKKVLQGRKTEVQDEKSRGEDEKTGVQNQRVFYGEVEKMQREMEDEKAVCEEKPKSMQDAEKRESQAEKKIGVQDEETRVQGEQDEETGVQHEERAEDEKAMESASPLHVKEEDEKAMEDVPSSHVDQPTAFMECTHTKHTIGDSCFETLTGSEQCIVATGCVPLLELASQERDDKSASELCANEEKKAPEALGEQSLHEGNAREESSNIECPSTLVFENDTSDVKVKVAASSEERGFVQKDRDAEKLQCGHIQVPINELDLITSKGLDSHPQAHNKSSLCSIPESSMQENLPCPTVDEIDVEKRVVDIHSASLNSY